MSQKLVNNIVNTLARTIDGIEMSESEICLLKAIILINQEGVHGLTPSTAQSLGHLRDRLHGTLYQNCAQSANESSTIRFARLLHIFPKLIVSFGEVLKEMAYFN